MQEEIVYLTHKKSKRIINDLKYLRDTSGNRPVTALTHNLNLDLEAVYAMSFNDSINEYLSYPMISNSITPGHAHFPLFYYFLKEKPASDYFWMIEYDVRFTGPWSELFNSFSSNDCDFLTAHLNTHESEPDWPWWDLEHPNLKKIPLSLRMRSFNPIFRISKRALFFLHNQFLSGWKGHNEVILASLMKQNGYSVGDFNHQPETGSKNISYYSCRGNKKGKLLVGTHRHKPPMTKPGFRKHTIYHPVKEDSGVGRVRWTLGNALRSFKFGI